MCRIAKTRTVRLASCGMKWALHRVVRNPALNFIVSCACIMSSHVSLTASELNLIYEDRWDEGKLTTEYIRYLHFVDPILWTPSELEREYGVYYQAISSLLRKKYPDRRKGERRKT